MEHFKVCEVAREHGGEGDLKLLLAAHDVVLKTAIIGSANAFLSAPNDLSIKVLPLKISKMATRARSWILLGTKEGAWDIL